MPFGLSTVAAKAIGIGLLVLALIAGFAWLDLHVEAAGAAKYEAQQAAAALKATQDAQAVTAQRETDQQENLREANNANTQQATDARDIDALMQRMRDQSAARSRAATSHPAAPGASQTSSVPPAGMVSADLYLSVVQMAVDASKYADCLRTGGELCAQDYATLTPKP